VRRKPSAGHGDGAIVSGRDGREEPGREAGLKGSGSREALRCH